MFRPGQVVVTASGQDWMGRFLKAVMGSPWTHVFIVVSNNEIVESIFGRGVRTYSLPQRIRELKDTNRAYIVLDYFSLNKIERLAISEAAKSYVGLGYNIISALYWFFFGYFFYDSQKRMICSRIITAAYLKGAKVKLFNNRKVAGLEAIHRLDLERGYATPLDILRWSNLRPDHWG